MFKALLWDMDNTLLDFGYSETHSLRQTLRRNGIAELTDKQVAVYSAINDSKWKLLEQGKLNKAEVMHERFAEFLAYLGATQLDPDEINQQYEDGLCDFILPIENGLDIVRSLKGKIRQYAVTNGAYNVQKTKLQKTGLDDILDGAFISDAVGFEKPSAQFFDYVLAHIIPCEKDEILIVGDSLSSDMQGGNNAGIRCCLYNPSGREVNTSLRIDYEIHSLNGVYEILNIG